MGCERESQNGAASVHAAPLSVASHLQPLWNEHHATILTGATLAASAQERSTFAYLKERLGIEDAEEAQYGSPFDYERHCRIYLPTDILDADDHEHHDSVANAIKMLSIAAGGRTMVLFRSYSAMNRVTRRIKDDLEASGLVLLRQGRDGSAAAIVEALRADPRSVAFGVSALWTGVDIPGDALSLLIMTRLPFAPPNDPVLKARGEQYDNEFMQFSLPAAGPAVQTGHRPIDSDPIRRRCCGDSRRSSCESSLWETLPRRIASGSRHPNARGRGCRRSARVSSADR